MSHCRRTPRRPRRSYGPAMQRRLPRPTWVDVLLAVAVTAMAAVELALGQVGGPRWATVPSALLFGAPLLWRRRFPWTALLVCYGTIFGLHLAGADQYNYLASVASALIIVFTFAGEVELGPAVAGLVLAAGLLTVSALQGVSSIVWGVGLVVGAWAAGRAIRARRLLIEELDRTTAALRESREEHARDAVAAERTRIARELHDVIAHSVGVMVVQAGAAEQMIPLSPERATTAAQSVQECGRQALTDLRRLLGVLRPDGEDAGELSPQPGLADVPELLERLRGAGLTVRLTRIGVVRPLAPTVDLAAFRIVQEGLTNVLKHAGARGASLDLRYDDEGVDIEIRNGAGEATVRRRVDGAGHGLIGMRERALMCGGSFAAGPEEDGGFAVRVRLPAEAR
jgi:signal transduction histidine kinase